MMAAAKGFNVQVPKVSFATAATNPITADPATTNTLQVYKLGVGEVRSDPPGINCGEACKTALSKLTSVTLTAIAPTSYNFTGWQGDCAGNAPTCTLSMNMPHIVTATFTSIPTLDGKMDCVLNWAEKTFPKDYYPASVSRVINGYYARHYTTPDVWLAMKFSDSHVYFVDAAGYMYDYGSIVLYLEQAGC